MDRRIKANQQASNCIIYYGSAVKTNNCQAYEPLVIYSCSNLFLRSFLPTIFLIFMALCKILLIFLLSFSPFLLYAQEAAPPPATKVFLDCNRCNEAFIKREIVLVDYVRDRNVADIHILITDQPLASGGRLYNVNFIGLSSEYPQEFTIELNTYQTDTDIEVNQKLAEVLQAGLMPFLITKSQVKMEVSRDQQATELNLPPAEDKWNFWVFDIGGRIDWEKESNQSEFELEGEINIQRTTELYRIRSEIETRYEINRVTQADKFLTSSLSRSTAGFSIVKSIADLWSAGVFTEIYSNTYNNIKLGTGLRAALEYSVFPYRMSVTRELTFAYLIGPRHFNYLEETIFNEHKENLFQQALRVNLRLRRSWGNLFVRLEGSHYLHDWTKNRLALNSNLSLQVTRGLFIRFGGRANLVNDQLFLPKAGASLEEILLQRRALATGYELDFYFGVAYTFGSIYNSIVNTRL